jgi:type IV pilus assembly protein PilB
VTRAAVAPAPSRPAVALELLRQRRLSPAALSAAGFDTLDAVLHAVAVQFRMPRLDLDTLELQDGLARRIPQAIAEKHRVCAVMETPLELTVATSDPTQIELLDWIGREVKRTVTAVLAGPAEIDRAIRRLYEPQSAVTVEAPENLSQEALAEATQIVNAIVAGAIAQRASDIHVEPSERELTVRYRIDGALRTAEVRPMDLHAAVVSRLKVMANLDIAIHQLPQDGRIKMRNGRTEIDLRVSVLPTFFGEKVVCRILDSARAALPLDELGFEPAQRATFERMIAAPNGLLLVTGPTGSGKSTTLYAALNAVRSPELNLVTVEDPVEYQLPGINQVQVNVKRGLTFAGALRSILRQDPDVVLIGEIRDHETGVIAAEAALTGHLVMSSLHTNDAVGAIVRLTELGIEPYLIAPTLVGVVAQRLLRKVCSECAERYVPDEPDRIALGLPELPAGVTFARGRGCRHCARTGHAGRIAVRELLEVDEGMRALISAGADTATLSAHAHASGFRTMRFQALRLAFAGTVPASEVLRATRG